MRLSERELVAAAVKLLPGQWMAAGRGEWAVTLLGSCVSVCLFDRGRGVGGMNHFMLPELVRGRGGPDCPTCSASCTGRYGSCAIKLLLARLEQLGAARSRLEAKLFGGGRVMAGVADIGEQNASFAESCLAELGIPVVASDLRGSSPRKVLFSTGTGTAFVKKIG